MPIRPYMLDHEYLLMVEGLATRNELPKPESVVKPDPNILVQALLGHIAWQFEVMKIQADNSSADLGTVVDINMRMTEANIAREIYLAMNDTPAGKVPLHPVGNDKIQRATERVLHLFNIGPTPPTRR